MKLIDSKGKLFGIINPFDLVVLVVLFCGIIFTVKWTRMAEDPSWVNVKLLHTRCVAFTIVAPYVADLIKAGDEAVNDDGLVVAKIEKVISNDPIPAIVYQSKDGEKVFFDQQIRNVVIELDLLSYRKKGEVYASISSIPIKTGAGFSITTKGYSGQFSVQKVLGSKE